MSELGSPGLPGETSRESGLLQRLRRSIRSLDPKPATLLVGFSGGGDSLALLALVASLARLGELTALAVHVDHRVRPSSSSDVFIARAAAEALQVPLLVRAVSSDRLQLHAGSGREEAMRRERYLAFANAMEQTGADVLALAHHERDQAETVLLHLLRGAGLPGAAGMRSEGVMTVPWWGGDHAGPQRAIRVWRPLLQESPDALRSVGDGLGLAIVDDESNRDETLRRNAIRHSVIPLLEAVVPGATRNLARFADIAGEESEELDAQARRRLDEAEGGGFLDRSALLGLPIAIRRRVLRLWIARSMPIGLEVSANRVDEVLRVAADKGRPRTVEIGLGLSVVVSANTLTIERHGVRL